ncbi:hypothetical protein GN244_ATG02433 [Phytophthora infestans]|uniref:Uncharacterized protein n=1 Tax=Phytophthora infestans TaxID=4787 RepID=A0A833X128_PHYIN|nr:hypothetical protein GN244_ATG02433 [Phytophthora infestans]
MIYATAKYKFKPLKTNAAIGAAWVRVAALVDKKSNENKWLRKTWAHCHQDRSATGNAPPTLPQSQVGALGSS